MISLIAVLKAKPGQTDALRQALQALLLPTRQEPGNLDYALFQLRDAPDTFYMREAWQGQDALDAHAKHTERNRAQEQRSENKAFKMQVNQLTGNHIACQARKSEQQQQT